MLFVCEMIGRLVEDEHIGTQRGKQREYETHPLSRAQASNLVVQDIRCELELGKMPRNDIAVVDAQTVFEKLVGSDGKGNILVFLHEIPEKKVFPARPRTGERGCCPLYPSRASSSASIASRSR